jgi:diaminohydroxyphosphoribosylaminopyrimidine deaminase / 5-amino-6-(5-phosphoribosylamino)uracil reductase
MDNDIKFMQRALLLAGRGQGRVSPNPMVGCVIVKQGKVIAEGWHKVYGADHAEVDALKKAGARAKGACMYVTLEPCSHWGKTPPCVDAVIAGGLTRVVVAMQDPDPRTNGRSIRKMRAHGIEVAAGVCEAEARELNAAFIKHVVKKMPYVTAKTAQTMDGKVGTLSGKVKWITSSMTRARSKARRAEFDAIMVGVSTVLADDPCLCAPGKAMKKIVVDSSLRTPLDARLFKGALPGSLLLRIKRRRQR